MAGKEALANRLIVLDPGHGGSDPGAVGPAGGCEKTCTLAMALALQVCLADAGANVMMTRCSDTDVGYANDSANEELRARVDLANRAGADVFISLHANAAENPEAHGTETWYYAAGQELAEKVAAAMAMLGLTDRGAKQGGFYVLKYTSMPAVLVETAFISNPQEEQLLFQPDFQTRVASAVAEGLAAWFQSI